MHNTDIKLLRDELVKVVGIIRKHELTIRKQGDQLALERDQAVLCMVTVRAENENLHGQLAKYGQVIKAYDNQHTPPSRKRSTFRIRRNEKRITPPGGRGQHVGHRCIGQPESRPDHTSHSRQVWFMWGHKPKGCQDCVHNKDRRPPSHVTMRTCGRSCI